MEIPQPQSNDGRARIKVAVILDNGFKANGVCSYTPEEFQSLLNSRDGDWLTFHTVSHRDGNTVFVEEILSMLRSKIVAWAISPLQVGVKIV